ncbi:MAG TPA: TM2 domain-containing protein [Gemmatimonadales bacterium]|nr:TM2 domain-containing protein [Gemmatimonadales bacterium]
MSPGISDKSRGVALILSALLGVFGVHRFYVGRVKSGLAMLFTVGGLGIWYLYDLIVIAGGGFKDAEGRALLNWEFEEGARPELPEQIYRELDEMRREIAELHERVDFSERLLANVRRDAESREGR